MEKPEPSFQLPALRNVWTISKQGSKELGPAKLGWKLHQLPPNQIKSYSMADWIACNGKFWSGKLFKHSSVSPGPPSSHYEQSCAGRVGVKISLFSATSLGHHSHACMVGSQVDKEANGFSRKHQLNCGQHATYPADLVELQHSAVVVLTSWTKGKGTPGCSP